jgi:hypothetical protein
MSIILAKKASWLAALLRKSVVSTDAADATDATETPDAVLSARLRFPAAGIAMNLLSSPHK